jgi:hypothetical protein
MWYAVLAENRGGALLEFGRDPTFQHWMQKMIASCPSRIWDKKQRLYDPLRRLPKMEYECPELQCRKVQEKLHSN